MIRRSSSLILVLTTIVVSVVRSDDEEVLNSIDEYAVRAAIDEAGSLLAEENARLFATGAKSAKYGRKKFTAQ